MKRSARIALVACVAVAVALIAPGFASAAKGLFVNGSGTVGTDKSCASPGYTTVQAAVNAAASGGVVSVCPGTYTEQIQIEKPLKIQLAEGGKATLQLPSTPAASTTSCDTAEGIEAGQIDEVSICTARKGHAHGAEDRRPCADRNLRRPAERDQRR